MTDSRAQPRLAFAAEYSKEARPRRPATKDMIVGLYNAAMTRSSCCSFRAVMEGIGTVIEAYQQRRSASCNRCTTKFVVPGLLGFKTVLKSSNILSIALVGDHGCHVQPFSWCCEDGQGSYSC